jgi:hypothetical protein
VLEQGLNVLFVMSERMWQEDEKMHSEELHDLY